MSYSSQNNNVTMLTWPITQRGKLIAQQFANAHSHPEIAERVRKNTLAVWVIHDFFCALGIATDLLTSDSWNPAMQAIEDVADLVVPGMGQLECRPVCGESTVYMLPENTWEERIGYVAVALNEGVGEATLLGFASEVPPTQPQLQREQLQPMEYFPAYLHQIRHEKSTPERSQLTQLSQWVEGYFDDGWQLAEDLLAQYMWTPAFRQSSQLLQSETAQQIKRAKQLDLGLKLGREHVALVLEIGQDKAFTNVGVRVYPLGGQMYLPESLVVKILDETGKVYLTAQSRSLDNYLQLYFRGHRGEFFSVQLDLADISLVEHFMI
ncbi:MAG: DUF1822 family protein [Cyanobacteria bacterium P01_D01_bin.156]